MYYGYHNKNEESWVGSGLPGIPDGAATYYKRELTKCDFTI